MGVRHDPESLCAMLRILQDHSDWEKLVEFFVIGKCFCWVSKNKIF
jgi:hypothetical protein